MLGAIGYFANTLAASLFWPFILGTIVCVAVGAISWQYRDDKYDQKAYGSVEYSNATWRMWACAQAACIMWTSYAVLSAVPGPNYNQVEVVRQVPIHSIYSEAYSQCIDDTSTKAFENGADGEHAFCNTRALSFVNMTPSVITQTRDVVRYRDRPQEVRYRQMFNTCMGGDERDERWTVDQTPEELARTGKSGAQLRTERITICHSNAIQIVGGRAPAPAVQQAGATDEQR